MPRDPRRPLSILIAALGGQGGGVLTEWIVGAADHAGHAVQSTSIPGVAQRTGATTYYIEIAPEPRMAGAPDPVFSLYATPGDVDVIIASEWLEAGRTLEMMCETDLRQDGSYPLVHFVQDIGRAPEKVAENY